MRLAESRRARRGAIGLLALLALQALWAAHGAAQLEEAADPAALFGRANEAFRDGRYDEAVAGYEALLEGGIDTPEIRYNLGNALLGRGELGTAVASYLRARRESPRDPDVLANLTFARASTQDDLLPPDPGRVASTLLVWHHRLSPAEAALGLALANLALWALLGLGLVKRARTDAWRAAVAAVALAVVALGGSLAVRSVAPVEVAVICAESVEARSGMGEEAVLRFELHEGTEVRVRERRPGWLRVELPSGPDGWIPEEVAEVVPR